MSAATIEPTTTSVLESLRNMSVSSTADAVKTAIANPSSNPTLSLLLVSCVVLAVILLVVFTVMLITPSRKRVKKIRRFYSSPEEAAAAARGGVVVGGTPAPRAAAPEPRGRVSRAMTSSSAIVVLVVLVVLGTYLATSTDRYCANTCHASAAAVAAAVEADHAACTSCHEAGIINVLANTASRGRMLVRSAMGASPEETNLAVGSGACLRCHREIAEHVITSERTGVVMSHAEVVAGGPPCSTCHAHAGHASDAFTASMSACLPCHDEETASAECSTCHSRDPSALTIAQGDSVSDGQLRLGSGRLVYPAVRAAKRECGGCHDEAKECDTCHGIRMPHTRAFTEGAHGRNAAFELKLSCWRCHDPQWCGRSGCHRGAFNPATGDTTHGGNWKAEHKRAPWDAGCGCHEGRGSKRKESICRLCHAADRTLLRVGH